MDEVTGYSTVVAVRWARLATGRLLSRDAGANIALLTKVICFTPFQYLFTPDSPVFENLIIRSTPPTCRNDHCILTAHREVSTPSPNHHLHLPSFSRTYFRPSFLSLLYCPSFSPPNFSTYTLTNHQFCSHDHVSTHTSPRRDGRPHPPMLLPLELAFRRPKLAVLP